MDEANSMGNKTPKKGVLCMKWDSDGELSTHDTDALIKRLAKAEKSRRTMTKLSYNHSNHIHQ